MLEKFKVLIVKKQNEVITRVVYQECKGRMNLHLGNYEVHNVDITELKQSSLFLRGNSNPHHKCRKSDRWFNLSDLEERINSFNKEYNERFQCIDN
jgi:hypothetical protein